MSNSYDNLVGHILAHLENNWEDTDGSWKPFTKPVALEIAMNELADHARDWGYEVQANGRGVTDILVKQPGVELSLETANCGEGL